ncbi:MAG TPA: hypothetical protein VFV22_01695, partial [Candidatus Paceibacterota bacterium]|nr:hypothetical protein [Candidatus Paceibacterota bacterium]
MVNNKKTNEYFEKLQNIKLSEASRTRIQNNLINYAHFNSIHENVSIPGDSRSIIRVPQRTTLFNLIKSKPMTAAIIAIVLMISGGASYAAEGSVPGELLYTIKTDVNENIKSA